MASFADRVAFVTGAGSGIGRAIAGQLLDAGAHVVLAELDERAGRDARDELSARGPVRLEHLDVADRRRDDPQGDLRRVTGSRRGCAARL
ncbi:SDR family NAD(P)-dependent oxidoreductase [Pseudenhygromyxa sp. WMMC2535]|uniref:SDR family NAD(P)-dependent oxidoreductase n=1 Tax=Pseudenhygromyxa sp. WMMC2535 TaxID=2712867 RepID=UPI001555DE0B|nr:SDR family NAD(P)-dependent oxidoreductase [Pseudenhygromyxa sp. WMMC2535]